MTNKSGLTFFLSIKYLSVCMVYTIGRKKRNVCNMSLITQFEWPMFYLKYLCIVLCILGRTKIKYYYYYYKENIPASHVRVNIIYNYTRRHIYLYRMFFADFSVHSQLIFMKFCKDCFRVTRRRRP